MLTPDQINEILTDLTNPHLGGHTCDGRWFNPNAGARNHCPTLVALNAIQEWADETRVWVHLAATDVAAQTRVAEGMTGLVLADLDPEDAVAWRTTAMYAIQALAGHLTPCPDPVARS